MKRKSKTVRKIHPSPSALDSNSPSSWHTWIIVGSIAVLPIVSFLNSFQGQFFFDDEDAIVSNEHIRHLWPLWDSLFKWGYGTRPVMGLSLAINYAISGLELWSYHAVNLAIHILAGWVLFEIVRRTLVQQRA